MILDTNIMTDESIFEKVKEFT